MPKQLEAKPGKTQQNRLVPAVRGLERARDPNADIENLIKRERLPMNPLLQSLALQILHHDERPAVVIAYIVNRADLWMIERRSRPRFNAESPPAGDSVPAADPPFNITPRM